MPIGTCNSTTIANSSLVCARAPADPPADRKQRTMPSFAIKSRNQPATRRRRIRQRASTNLSGRAASRSASVQPPSRPPGAAVSRPVPRLISLTVPSAADKSPGFIPPRVYERIFYGSFVGRFWLTVRDRPRPGQSPAKVSGPARQPPPAADHTRHLALSRSELRCFERMAIAWHKIAWPSAVAVGWCWL